MYPLKRKQEAVDYLRDTVFVPDCPKEGENFFTTAMDAIATDIYFLSANAMSENGEIVNIDAGGNRLAGSVWGHQKVYFVVGTNKIEENLEKAIYRARNFGILNFINI